MNSLKITYEEALRDYPEAVDVIMAKLRVGRSKRRLAKAEDLYWEYTWCTQIEGPNNFESIFSNSPIPPTKITNSFYLEGSIGRFHCSTDIDEPPAVSRYLGKQNVIAEDKRCMDTIMTDSLTPSEKEDYEKHLLKELGIHKFYVIR